MQIKISDELNQIINLSKEEAMRTGSYSVGADHLFLGILRHGDNIACTALSSFRIDLEELKQFIDDKVFTNEVIPYSEIDNISFSRGSHNILSLTILEATRLRSATATPSHLLLALCRAQNYGQAFLRDNGVDYGRIINYLDATGVIQSDRETPKSGEKEENSGEGSVSFALSVDEKKAHIEDYSFDLTEAAREGKLDPVVGRETEIERVVQILGRRRKNNPMLVGDPGVGKSAVVEGIAARIVDGRIPESLKGKKLMSLDIASVVAGTRYRGDFEKRLKEIIDDLKEKSDIILFIDEFHTIVGAGSSSDSLDAANMLKPALARGDIQCIGATTVDEFTKIVEKDGALDRRFQKVRIEPTDEKDSLEILREIRDNYEKHHDVKYTDEALVACVKMSERYISGRCLPDKAIDVMDEAGSMVKIRQGKKTEEDRVVSEDDVAAIVSQISGIPVSRIAESEGERLLKMKERLGKRIIGQKEAIDTVARAICRNRAGVKDPSRPIGTFLFLGPTGVGKTQLAKSLAEYLFDSQDNMVRIDMSEYSEKISSSRLIGAPPGYVGFDEGGQLSEKVRQKPYCVVLLDEIEKAHPDIFSLLLQVLDDGRLTDSNGHTVSFRNTILIMTSNAGSREVEEYGRSMGFSTNSSKDSSEFRRKNLVEKALKKTFPPEFINRIDEQVFFNSLKKEDIEKIVEIELKELKQRVSEAGYLLGISDGAKKLIADAGYDPSYGARPLRRAVQKYVEDPVSEFIIADRLACGMVKTDKSKIRLNIVLSKDKESTCVSCRKRQQASIPSS